MTNRSAPTGPPRGPQWRDPVPEPAPDPAAARGRRSVVTHSLAVLGGLLVGVLIGVVGAGGKSAPDPPVSPSATSQTTSTPTGEAPATTRMPPERTSAPAGNAQEGIPGEGTFLVGEEVEPGTYRSTGPAGEVCYWARLKGTTGEADEIIANSTSKGQSTVTVLASDKAFETNGCKAWKRIG
ncbi:hypothetical protein ACH4OX_17125 [Streptomyces roseolus]|uniref:hypothetical protein n=1 Tax=Streptomyces roseolus TaxID=67358 RepID=UPI00379FF315